MKIDYSAFNNCKSLKTINLINVKKPFALNIFPEFDNLPLDVHVLISGNKDDWINILSSKFCQLWFIINEI